MGKTARTPRLASMTIAGEASEELVIAFLTHCLDHNCQIDLDGFTATPGDYLGSMLFDLLKGIQLFPVRLVHAVQVLIDNFPHQFGETATLQASELCQTAVLLWF
jgi:hypothetical protein